MTVAGQYLKDTVAAHVSGAGVTARVLAEEAPADPEGGGRAAEGPRRVREKAAAAGAASRDDVKAAEATRRRLAVRPRPANPSLGEFVTAEVAVDAGAAGAGASCGSRPRRASRTPIVFGSVPCRR